MNKLLLGASSALLLTFQVNVLLAQIVVDSDSVTLGIVEPEVDVQLVEVTNPNGPQPWFPPGRGPGNLFPPDGGFGVPAAPNPGPVVDPFPFPIPGSDPAKPIPTLPMPGMGESGGSMDPDRPNNPDDPDPMPGSVNCIGFSGVVPLSPFGPGGHGSFSIFLDPPGDNCMVVLDSYDPGAAVGGSIFVNDVGHFTDLFLDGSTAPGPNGYGFDCETCAYVGNPPSPATLQAIRVEQMTGFRVRFTITFEVIDVTQSRITIDDAEIL